MTTTKTISKRTNLSSKVEELKLELKTKQIVDETDKKAKGISDKKYETKPFPAFFKKNQQASKYKREDYKHYSIFGHTQKFIR